MLLQLPVENLSLGTFLRPNRMDALSSGYLVVPRLHSVNNFFEKRRRIGMSQVMVTVRRMVLLLVNWFCNQRLKGDTEGLFLLFGQDNHA